MLGLVGEGRLGGQTAEIVVFQGGSGQTGSATACGAAAPSIRDMAPQVLLWHLLMPPKGSKPP